MGKKNYPFWGMGFEDYAFSNSQLRIRIEDQTRRLGKDSVENQLKTWILLHSLTFVAEMAIIRPFRAWRYNEAVVKDIDRKFSPLFDVVGPEELQQLYKIPNNSIHLSVPRSLKQAKAKTIEWKSKEVIMQDPLPGIYIYYQYFWLYGDPKRYVRKGFICMIRMDDEQTKSEPGIILHENTITSSVKDRCEVLEATLLNIAPTHGLYEDPENSLEKLMDSYIEHPYYEHIDYQGVTNKLAIVQNKEDIQKFLRALKGKPVYLADGHHRFASSELLKKKLKEEGQLTQDDSIVNYHLIYLTNLYASDISILPIHRVVHLTTAPDETELLHKLADYFEITDATNFRAPLYEELQTGISFGMALGNKQYLLRLLPSIKPATDIPLKLPVPVKNLEYTILHYFIFDRILGMEYSTQTGNDSIEYIKDYNRAMTMAKENPATLSFITRGLSLKNMLDVCNAGSLMPQKSTYFYPKVICGPVFASIDEKENDSPFDSCFRLPPP